MSHNASPFRRRLAILQLFLLLGVTLQPDAFAFKQRYHEQTTEKVLKDEGFDADSADEAGDSNYWTDVFELLSDAAHSDNNRLDLASDRLRQKRTQIGNQLNACARRAALDNFGEALHTVQDIFSHSNSIDNNLPIGDILSLSRGTAQCSLPNFSPGGLVTGYFNVIGGTTRLQCFRMPAGMCCHYDLNKDEPSAPNGGNGKHDRALSAAEDRTHTYLHLVEDDLRARFGDSRANQLIKIFKKKQRTTYFVIDDTGSMSNDLAGVKASVNGFLNQILAGDEAPTLGLVTFKDDVNDRANTCDLEQLRGQVNALFASGGGDCPEASNSAMLQALTHFPEVGSDMQLTGGRILLATDASAGDSSLGPQVLVEALSKGVSIDAILTGDCAAEESFAAGEDVAPSDNGDAVAGAPAALAGASAVVDPLTSISARTQLRALTEQSGGVLFNVSRVEVDDVVPTLLDLGRPDMAILASRKVDLTTGVPYVLQVPVDDTLREKVTFMVTASRSGILPAVTLTRPSGAVVNTTDPDVVFRNLSSVRSYAITAPATGRWAVRLDGQGTFVVRAFGATPFRLNSVRLLEPELGLRRPEVEVAPLDGLPVVGTDLQAQLRFTDAPSAVDAALRRLDGGLLEDLDPQPLDGVRRFQTALHVPDTTFFLEATGVTAGGSEFVRQLAVAATPQTVGLAAAPEMSVAAPGTDAVIQATVRNAGTAPATYRLRGTASLFWPLSLPAPVTVDAGASVTVEVRVTVPAGTLEGTASDLTLFAEDVTATRVRNSAAVTVVAGSDNRPPDCSGAAAEPNLLWPPNHELAGIRLGGVTDPDGDAVDITVTGITQDEPVLGTGSGDTAPDAAGVGTSAPQVRAERAGNGDGRVYTLAIQASDGHGGTCDAKVTVGVPHNQGGSQPVDNGSVYDSTADH